MPPYGEHEYTAMTPDRALRDGSLQLEAQDIGDPESRRPLLRIAEELIPDSQMWRDKPWMTPVPWLACPTPPAVRNADARP